MPPLYKVRPRDLQVFLVSLEWNESLGLEFSAACIDRVPNFWDKASDSIKEKVILRYLRELLNSGAFGSSQFLPLDSDSREVENVPSSEVLCRLLRKVLSFILVCRFACQEKACQLYLILMQCPWFLVIQIRVFFKKYLFIYLFCALWFLLEWTFLALFIPWYD